MKTLAVILALCVALAASRSIDKRIGKVSDAYFTKLCDQCFLDKDATECKVHEETSDNGLKIETEVICLKAKQVLSDNVLSRDNPYPGAHFERNYDLIRRHYESKTLMSTVPEPETGFTKLCDQCFLDKDATECKVHEETGDNGLKIETEVICLKDKQVLSDNVLSLDNPYPSVHFERNYDQIRRHYESKPVKSVMSAVPQAKTDFLKLCHECFLDQGATECKVHEETSDNGLKIETEVICLKDKQVLSDNVLSNDNPNPSVHFERNYDLVRHHYESGKTLMSAVPETETDFVKLCDQCFLDQDATECKVHEGTTDNGLKIETEVVCLKDKQVLSDNVLSRDNPYPRIHFEYNYDQVRRHYEKSVMSAVPESETDLVKLCHQCFLEKDATECKVHEATGDDGLKIETEIVCLKDKQVLSDNVLSRDNPYPHVHFKRNFDLVRHHYESKPGKTVMSAIPATKTDFVKLCDQCFVDKDATECKVHEGTTDDGLKVETEVVCLKDKQVLSDNVLSRDNPYPSVHFEYNYDQVRRHYESKSAKSVMSAVPETETDFVKVCNQCFVDPDATECKVHEETSDNGLKIETEVICLKNKQVLSDDVLSRDNPFPNVHFERNYDQVRRHYESKN